MSVHWSIAALATVWAMHRSLESGLVPFHPGDVAE
jgi:hypothetical protein